MRSLWDKARLYGKVSLYTHDDGTVSCTITFNSIKHTELKANSGYGLKCPEKALEAAIKTADEIVQSTTSMGEKIKSLLLGSK